VTAKTRRLIFGDPRVTPGSAALEWARVATKPLADLAERQGHPRGQRLIELWANVYEQDPAQAAASLARKITWETAEQEWRDAQNGSLATLKKTEQQLVAAAQAYFGNEWQKCLGEVREWWAGRDNGGSGAARAS